MRLHGAARQEQLGESQSGRPQRGPAIPGSATVMDSIFKAEDATGSGSEHGGNAEIA